MGEAQWLPLLEYEMSYDLASPRVYHLGVYL